jgi:hypothetical protein
MAVSSTTVSECSSKIRSGRENQRCVNSNTGMHTREKTYPTHEAFSQPYGNTQDKCTTQVDQQAPSKTNMLKNDINTCRQHIQLQTLHYTCVRQRTCYQKIGVKIASRGQHCLNLRSQHLEVSIVPCLGHTRQPEEAL